jgi:hypothetical protein
MVSSSFIKLGAEFNGFDKLSVAVGGSPVAEQMPAVWRV